MKWFDLEQLTQVGLGGLKCVVSDFTLYSIHSGMLSLWSVLRTGVTVGFHNSTNKSIMKSLEVIYLGDVMSIFRTKELQ